MISAILSIHCNNTKELDDRVFPLVLKKEKEYTFDIISKGGPIFAKIEDDHHIYVYFLTNQDKNCEVFKMSDKLEIKKSYIIKRGDGPGEARNPRIYGGDRHSVLLYDAPAFKYCEYDANFKLITEYRLKDLGTFLYNGARFVPDRRFVLDGYRAALNFYERAYRLYLMKLKEKEIVYFKLFETKMTERKKDNNKSVSARLIHFGYFYKHIFILDKRDYKLVKMNEDGEVLKERKIPFKSKNFAPELRERWIEKFYGARGTDRFDYPEKLWSACWLMPIAGGIAVGRCENYQPDVKGPIPADFFDRDLNYLGKIYLPYVNTWNDPLMGSVFADNKFYYKDGKLYVIEEKDETYRVTQWGVKIEKN